MTFGQLILTKIIKIVAAICQILRLKCTKIDFGWSSTQDPAGELTALPQTSWNRGDLLLMKKEGCREGGGEMERSEEKGREGKRREGGKRKEGKGKEEEGKGIKGGRGDSPHQS